MGIDTNKICFGCFSEKSTEGPCLKCGFDIATAKHPAIALPIGTILNGRYLTGRVLGVGGFGVTYLALDMTLETTVAVKEYLPSGIAIRDNDHYTMTVSSQDEQERFNNGATKFLDEARILAKLRTVPNIVTVHDYFRENGTAYFVMEYIEGVDLLKYAYSKGGKLSFEETRDLMLPIIKSLGLVHEHNLLHRDISPDNIIVTRGGTTHLLDFGAARLAIDSEKSKSIILKHGFAPEEQYRKHGNQGPWSDEYALAATMYLVMTGVMPPDAIERVHEDTLEAPSKLGISIPKYAEEALMRALSVHASGRFPDMASFAEAITGKNVPTASLVAAAAAPVATSDSVPTSQPSPFAASSQTAESPFKPASVAPAAPAAPVAPSAFRPAPVSSQSVSPVPQSVSPAPIVTTQAKKSIWQKPLTYIIAGIILLAGIAAPVTYFALKNKKADETTTETTKKKTKKTGTETTEEPTDTTTEQPTATLPTTSAPTLPSTSQPISGYNYYTIEDLSYRVTDEWTHIEQGIYHYFFTNTLDTENFLMVYATQALQPTQLNQVDFDAFMDGFTTELCSGNSGLDNAQVVSQTINKDTYLNYSDVTLTCTYEGKAKELPMRVILDTKTGKAYVYMLYINADMNSAEKDGFLTRFYDVLNSIQAAGAQPTPQGTTPTTANGPQTAYSEGIYNFSFSDEWQYMSKGGYQYFFVDQSQATSNFMMIYSQDLMTASQLKSYGYERTLNEFNQGIVSSFGANAKLESCEMYLDADRECSEDILVSGEYEGKQVELPIHIIIDKETGKAYVFAMYICKDIDSATKQDIMEKYNSCIASIERAN